LLSFAPKTIPKFSSHKIEEETLVLTQSGKKKDSILCDTLVKEFIPKKHGAVNKLLQGCRVWVPLGFLSLVNFHQIWTREKWFQPVQRIFHEKTTQKCQILKEKNSLLPNFYDKLQ
jgi:hypothetical protein